MKTAVTIPWEAVVEGCPPSQTRALPLVVSSRCRSQLDSSAVDAISRTLQNPLAVAVRGPSSSLVEVALPCRGQGVTLTSDGETAVVLQATWPLTAVAGHPNCEARTAAVARTFV